MPVKDRLFEIWFALRVGIASTEFRTLLEQYGTPYDIFNADESEIEALPCSERLKSALSDRSLQEASRIMEFCREQNIGLLFWQDEAYPKSLRPLRDPPVLLYYRGRLPDLSRRLCISVVGTRRMSEYGKRMAYKIGYELAAAGTVVVSGMALGNDSVAAAGAITAGGETVAVLGCGIDVVYPKEHETLYRETTVRGAVITEYAPGTPPSGQHFPVRNRIISGLSQGTLVIEGNERSGALITAKTAILQGRDIYAIPGNIGEANTAGTNELISDGAAVVLSARDILDNYAFLYRDSLDMNLLLRAEAHSDLNDTALLRLGVCTRAEAPPKTLKTPSAPQGSTPKAPPKPTPKAVPEKAPAPQPAPAPARGDASELILKTLTDTQRGIFEAVPLDRPVPVEYLSREGFTMSQIMAAVTILEIKGLLETLPGGLISRK